MKEFNELLERLNNHKAAPFTGVFLPDAGTNSVDLCTDFNIF